MDPREMGLKMWTGL